MEDTPLISVLIPVYNAEEYLKDCIESLLNQSYPNFEAIFVNDGSTDNSVEIIESYKASDNRIKLYHQDNNGPSAARNCALRHASGQYIMKLDADDFVSNDYMATAISRIAENGAEAAISDMYMYVNENDIRRHIDNYTSKVDFNRDSISGKDGLIKSIYWENIHSYLIIRRDIYDGIEYDTSGTFGDEVTERKLISRCKKLVYFSGKYFYRFNPTSVTKKISLKRFDLCKSYVQTKSLLKECNIYPATKHIIEPKMLNALTSIQYLYFKYKDQLTHDEQIKAQEEINYLFRHIDSKFLEHIYHEKGFLNLFFFKLKMLSPKCFSFLSRILYIKMKRVYGN